jgi:hypothetical protein
MGFAGLYMTERKNLLEATLHRNFRIFPMSEKQGFTARIRRVDGSAFQYDGSMYGAISTKRHRDMAAAIEEAKDIIDKHDVK